MDEAALKDAVSKGKIEWLKHSLQRMMERGVSRAAVLSVLANGELLEDYPEDRPYPSALFLGWHEGSPLHVVAAYDKKTGYCLVVTVYKPDSEHFEPDYRKRRKA